MNIGYVELFITGVGAIAFLPTLFCILYYSFIKGKITKIEGKQVIKFNVKNQEVELNLNTPLMILAFTLVVALAPLLLKHFKTDLSQYKPMSEVNSKYMLKTDVEEKYIPKSKLKLTITGKVISDSNSAIRDAKVIVQDIDSGEIIDETIVEPTEISNEGFYGANIENIKLENQYYVKAISAGYREDYRPVYINHRYVELKLRREE